MAAVTRAIKSAIVAKIEKDGSASPKEIAQTLGAEWQTPAQEALLRQLLGRMVKKRLLRIPSRGRYELSPSHDMRAIGGGWEGAILAFLRKRGGVARTGEIHWAVLGEKPKSDYRTSGHTLITRVLHKSPLFHQDYRRGYWNLGPDEMDRLPLLGWWKNHLIQTTGGYTHARVAQREVERTAFFRRVGGAFADARDALDILEVAEANPVLGAILNEMTLKTPTTRAKALADLEARVANETGLEGHKLWDAIDARKTAELAALLLLEFEDGDIGLHLAAPIEFYEACASIYGVCPVALSRGTVIPTSCVR